MTQRDEATPSAASKRFGTALSWSYVMNVGRISTTLGLSLVLARLLGPEAFGLIAMANVYILFVEILVRQGLFVAIVQFPDLDDRHLNTAFWLTAVSSLILTPLSMLLSAPWAAANQTPELGSIILVLSLLIPLKGLSVVQEARFTRSMEFKLLAVRGNSAVIAGGIIGLIFALLGAGVWALVAQQLAGALIEAAIIWQASKWRPRLQFDRVCARQLMDFGWRNSLANIGNFANHRADALLIGLMFGPVTVGLYRMAARLIETALEFAVGGLQTISLPELSKLALEPEAFKARALELMNMIAIVAATAFAILAASSDALFRMLGPAWAPSADPLKVMAILGFTAAITNLVGPVLDALGLPGKHAKLMWVGATTSVLSFLGAGWVATNLLPEYELAVLAVLRTFSFVLAAVLVSLPFLKRHANITFREVAGASLPPFIAAAIGASLASAAIHSWVPLNATSPVVGFGIVVSASTVACVLAVPLVDRRARGFAGTAISTLRNRMGASAP